MDDYDKYRIDMYRLWLEDARHDIADAEYRAWSAVQNINRVKAEKRRREEGARVHRKPSA